MSKKTQVKYKKAPQAPRRFKSSYMFFSTEKHKLIRKELADENNGEVCKVSTTEVAKMVSRAWKNINTDEREEWEELARRDKARYEMEKTMYTGPWKVPAKKRSQKDPNAPKRPMSAFLSFSNSKRALVKSKHPDIGNAEVSRILAQMWKDASEDERKDHIDKEFKLRQTYKIAIAAWRKNSENEMQAARKEREDEAMKAVLAGKSASDMENNSNDHMENQQSAASYPNQQDSYYGATPSYPASNMAHPHYYPQPQHQYSQAAYGESSLPPMDPAPAHSHASYYEQRPPGYEGYAQTYFQGHPYPNPYENSSQAIDPHQQYSTTQHYPSDPYGQHPPYYSSIDGNAADEQRPASAFSYAPHHS